MKLCQLLLQTDGGSTLKKGNVIEVEMKLIPFPEQDVKGTCDALGSI
jgi:hypothetical protein